MNLSRRFKHLAGATALSFALILSGSFIAAPSTYAAGTVQVGGTAVVTNTDGDNIRVRQGAGTDNKQIAEAHEGETVSVLAGPTKDSKGNTWFKIAAPGGTGWILTEFLSGKSAPAAAPKAAAPRSAPAVPAISGFARVAHTDGDNLRVRGAASRNGSVVTTLTPGTSVAVKSGQVVDSESIAWYQVSANGITGWAMAEYLAQAEAPAAPKPVVQAQPAIQVQAKPAAAPAAPAAPQAAPQADPVKDNRSAVSRGAQPPPAVQSSSLGQNIVSIAMRYRGYRYVFGGMSPAGFDCSGFVCYVVNKAGKGISRDMYSQLNSGARVSSSNLQPGDLLFFSNTYKRGLSHAGIYIGNGKFIHAENESTGVTISSVWSAYWAAHYTAAVRLK